MNKNLDATHNIAPYQLEHFQDLIGKLFQCCQERMQYQSERFALPDAELRCLKLFDQQRYLTAKSITRQMNVVKSRVTKIIDGLSRKGFVQRVKDPQDSRITLLSLTPAGQAKIDEINQFMAEVHLEVLNRMPESQRTAVLSNLELLRSAMQSVKEMMT